MGQGGTGLVYRATQLSLERIVALKVIAPQFASSESFQQRFRQEAYMAGTIEHPNILPLYEAGEAEGLLYISMRFVQGTDMAALLQRETLLAPRRAVRIVEQVAAALDAAHHRMLVHRDVKPANVLISRPGEREHVYLADFGLAQNRAITVTSPGHFVGTLRYAPPEQIQGSQVGPYTDVYALGCVLYHALTGAPPFEREGDAALIYAHLMNLAAPISARMPALAAFDPVIVKALAKDPEKRFASAGALAAAALEACEEVPLSEATIPAIPRPPSPAADLGPAFPAPSSSPGDTVPDARAAPSASTPIAIGAPTQAGERTALAGSSGAPPSQPPPLTWPPPPPEDWRPSEVQLQPLYRPIRIPLDAQFRYVHEPLVGDGQAVPFLGNDRAVAALAERIEYSTGGAFLVTGFRGVGKSTVIRRAVEEMRKAAQPGAEVLAVYLNVARPTEVDELLFQIVRRLFEALSDEQVLDNLNPEVKRSLLVAYTRTSLSFKESRSNTTERSGAASLGAGSLPVLGGLGPKLDLSGKRSSALATEVSFLAYSDTDAEHDFLRIVTHIRRAENSSRTGLRARLARRRSPPWAGKLVVVIDELDKLTDSEDGKRCLDVLLSSLKNLFTAAGVHFLFVGGPDLHGIAQQASYRGNSVYESVFSWQLYIPCVWRATERLLEAITAGRTYKVEGLAELRDYLEFKSRGIPRLLLMELNALVHWSDGVPIVNLEASEVARVEFYAGLQRTLADFLAPDQELRPFAVPIDEDRWRLGAYYITDWILRSQRRSFTIQDIAKTGEDASVETNVDPLLVRDPRKVQELLDHLLERDIVERIDRDLAQQTYVGDLPGGEVSSYRISAHVHQRLAGFARSSERERADLGAASVASGGAAQRGPQGEPLHRRQWGPATLGVVADGRFELVEEIDRSSTTRSYRAIDTVWGDVVTIKLLDAPGAGVAAFARARLLREIRLAARLRHPNIAAMREHFVESDGRSGIVLDHVVGPSLAQVCSGRRLPAKPAIGIALELLGALDYLESQHIARIDLKPHNVVLAEGERPVIVDLGLAKQVAPASADHAITGGETSVGTPAYMAPEQILGGPVDIRADLYSLALILVEMLTGRPARAREPEESPVAMLQRLLTADLDLSGLAVSEELRKVLERALQREPKARYAHPAELRDALRLTPEGRTEQAQV